MARLSSKHIARRHLLLLAFVALLGLALVADFLWASSSRTADSTLSTVNLLPKEAKEKVRIVKELNATFADLPAPMLEWEEMAEAPVVRLDGAAIQIKNLLYVFNGYGTIDYVHSLVNIFDFADNKWKESFAAPKEMAHSHLGMATDGRYIYIVTGQYGPQCRGPIARCFVLDTMTKKWADLPSLPFPRYAPATQLWRGRLHVMGGSKEDRHEPALDHWSIAVKDGKALENEWRTEIPIPRGGPHRACVVVNDRLYVIGGGPSRTERK